MQKNGDFVKFYGKLSNFVSKTLFVWIMQMTLTEKGCHFLDS